MSEWMTGEEHHLERTIAELEAEVAKLKAERGDLNDVVALRSLFVAPSKTIAEVLRGEFVRDRQSIIEKDEKIRQLHKENVKLKAELANADRCVLERENANGALDADNARLRDLLRLRRECLVDAITLADNGIVASRGATMRWREALGPLPGEQS